MFVSIKPLHVSIFFLDHLQGFSAVFCAVTIPTADLLSRCIITQYVAACVCHLCVFGGTDDIHMRPHTA